MYNFSTAKESLQGVPVPLPAGDEDSGPGTLRENLSDVLLDFEDPREAWESYRVKKLLLEETEKWVFGLADWKVYLTLTFRDEKPPDVAKSLFRWFVRKNNEHAFGKRYRQKVGHSYFSYVVGLEYQTRDVVHFHALVDQPLDFSYIHDFWGDRCGFAWIDGKIKSKAATVGYVCKYTVKGGELDFFVQKKNRKPAVLPSWWKGDFDNPSRVSQGALFALDDLRSP